MKTLLFLLAIWGLLGLMQCSKKDSDQVAALDQTIKLQNKQSTTVKAVGTDVQLTVTNIADSRCPSDVTCVWGGQANVNVELRDKAGTMQAADLCLGACQNDSAAVVLDAVPYWLCLTAVDPYPVASAPLPIRTATLRLTRQ
ncbi:hypothetical protein [Hymenobacter sp.]|jgi:hypothetical protein|uniref:hypothetical protein n=1 Tax=Hymenobacter sp. TaxID=1898978 RepID=UPI002ED82C17